LEGKRRHLGRPLYVCREPAGTEQAVQVSAQALLLAGVSSGWFSSSGAIEETPTVVQAASEISPVEHALAQKGD